MALFFPISCDLEYNKNKTHELMSHCAVRIIIACVISKVAARAVRAQRGPYLDVIPHSHFESLIQYYNKKCGVHSAFRTNHKVRTFSKKTEIYLLKTSSGLGPKFSRIARKLKHLTESSCFLLICCSPLKQVHCKKNLKLYAYGIATNENASSAKTHNKKM